MSVLGKIFGGFGGEIIKSLDGLLTSKEEKLLAKNKLQEILQRGKQQVMEYESNIQSELTRRLELDIQSDSWLSKNIRPMSLAFLLIVYTILALTDGNLVWGKYEFTIGQSYVSGFQNLLLMVFAFYFTGRTVENYTKVKAKQVIHTTQKNTPPPLEFEWDDDEDTD